MIPKFWVIKVPNFKQVQEGQQNRTYSFNGMCGLVLDRGIKFMSREINKQVMLGKVYKRNGKPVI